MTLSDRFWSKVNKTDTCWLWTGCRGSAGYGQLYVAGHVLYAHRIAWDMVNDPLPRGLQLDHLCRVRACVNPAHLEPVTRRENILRGISPSAVHARKTHCPAGHAYDEQNTYVDDGSRYCRACRNERSRQRRAQARMGIR
jgi:hypothetical protein